MFNTINQNILWKNVKLNNETCKYYRVYVESPSIVQYDDIITMLVRCDNASSPYSYVHTDNALRVANTLHIPKVISCDVSLELRETLRDYNNLRINRYLQKEKINPIREIFYSGLITKVIERDSFIHSDGKIAYYGYIGMKYLEMEDISEELEWFAKTYPQYQVFVTLCHHDNDTDVETPEVTLMLHKGLITVVPTRTLKQMAYVHKLSYTYESKLEEFFKKLWFKISGNFLIIKNKVLNYIYPEYQDIRNHKAFYKFNLREEYFKPWEVSFLLKEYLRITRTKD